MRNQISGVSDDEHVADVGFGKSGRQHTAVHTSEKQSLRLWVVFHLYELLDHSRPIRPPILHYAPKYPVHVLRPAPGRSICGYSSPHFWTILILSTANCPSMTAAAQQLLLKSLIDGRSRCFVMNQTMMVTGWYLT